MLEKSQMAPAGEAAQFPISRAEFIALMALLMALTALSVDVMLPALPQIGHSLGVTAKNDSQLILSFYLGGFAAGQFLSGPISDRFGRKLPLQFGLALYVCGTIFALISATFTGLLSARVLQGLGAAFPRVIALAIVRDRFEGREMSRVMSFITMVFLVVPILAPAVGEAILQLAAWRSIFYVLLFVAIVCSIWVAARLPETCATEDRLPLSSSAIWHAVKLVTTSRQAIGYVIAMGFVFGLLVSYVISAEQVFVDVFGLGAGFPVAFGAIAAFMIAGSLLNASLVRKAGMRVMSHRALLGALAGCGLMAIAGYPEKPPLLLFCAFMACVFFAFGIMMPNFNALAMEPMGHIAGTASSVAGFYSTAAAAVLGTLIGRAFDGGVRPLCVGITILFASALLVVAIAERFRLMQHRPVTAVSFPHSDE